MTELCKAESRQVQGAASVMSPTTSLTPSITPLPHIKTPQTFPLFIFHNNVVLMRYFSQPVATSNTIYPYIISRGTDTA